MKIKSILLAIVGFAIIFASLPEGIAANASSQPEGDGLICNENVRKAILACWEKTNNGFLDIEFGFSVVKEGSDYTMVFSRNDHIYLKANIFIPSGSVAVFHVHPNRTPPEPSRQDELAARRINIPVCTITNRGVYCYYPDRNETRKVRNYPDWQNPCK